jgi:hypothetical protein
MANTQALRVTTMAPNPLKMKTILHPETRKEPEGSLNVKKQLGSDPNYVTPITQFF